MMARWMAALAVAAVCGAALANDAQCVSESIKDYVLLPQNAYWCDLAFVGDVTDVDRETQTVRFAPAKFYFGNTGTNSVIVHYDDAKYAPTTAMSNIFCFASTVRVFKNGLIDCEDYAYDFSTSRTDIAVTSTNRLDFLCDATSWFDVSADSGVRFQYATNYINAMRMNFNPSNIMQVVVDGGNVSRETSAAVFYSTALMAKYWPVTLPDDALHGVYLMSTNSSRIIKAYIYLTAKRRHPEWLEDGE